MKIVINTNYDSAGSKVCVDDMSVFMRSAGYEVARNDWKRYAEYDIALFMAPDSDVKGAKKRNPRILTGVMDPKISMSQPRLEAEARRADFLLVSSIEQRDFFLRFNRNIVVYYMFPQIEEVAPRKHSNRGHTVIGYHGNKVHLEQLGYVRDALDGLAERYSIEFWAMYNMEKLGHWNRSLPRTCPVRHIQWSEANYHAELAKCDIGIVPGCIPIQEGLGKLASRSVKSFFLNEMAYNPNDYLLRFKYSANPGRIYLFSQLFIPVVADFTPSACQLIQDGRSGYLVYSREGWYTALETLLQNPGLRNTMSSNLKEFIASTCSPKHNFAQFELFLQGMLVKK